MLNFTCKRGERLMERKKYEQLMGKNGDEKAILDYDFNMIAGKVLKERRTARGLSLDGLSDKINNLVSKQAISRYENGEARIKNNVFIAICYALDCEPVEIYTEISKRYFEYLDNNMESILKRIEDKK